MTCNRPWMPLYVTDYMADTIELGADEHGVYMMLLMLAWRRADGAIPNDMAWLKRALSSCMKDMHGTRFKRLVPPLLSRFFSLDSQGNWRQKRLTKEREKVEKIAEKQREKAEKRWSAPNKNNDLRDASAVPQFGDAAMLLNTSDSHSHKKTEAYASAAPVKQKRSTKARTQISESWQPDDQGISYALARGFAGEKLRQLIASFVNYHRGKGSLMADWNAAWRTWCDNEVKFRGNGNGISKPLTQHQIERETSRKILDDLKFAAGNGVGTSGFGLLRLDSGDGSEGLHGGVRGTVIDLPVSGPAKGDQPF